VITSRAFDMPERSGLPDAAQGWSGVSDVSRQAFPMS
jgi:hypothetical protein